MTKRPWELLGVLVFAASALMLVAGSACAAGPYDDNCSLSLTTGCFDKTGLQCGADWSFTGSLSCAGQSLNDSDCKVGGIISKPVENQPLVGSIALTNYRLQDQTTCPDAEVLARYNGAAQSFEITAVFFFIQNTGNYVWEGDIVSESGGKANGQIESYLGGQFDWNPEVNGSVLTTEILPVETSFN